MSVIPGDTYGNGLLATPPSAGPDSPGNSSAASSGLREEYAQLISHAVVVPNTSLLMGEAPAVPTLRQPAQVSKMTQRISPLSLRQELQNGTVDDSSTISCSDSNSNESDLSTSPGHTSTSPDLSGHTSHCEGYAGVASSRPPVFTLPMDRTSPLSTRNVSKVQQEVVLSNQQSSAADIGQHDEDSQRLEGQIDGFTKELKQCILAEFSQARSCYAQKLHLQQSMEQERHAALVARLERELDDLRQLVSAFEGSLKHKDQVIENLTQSLNKQRKRHDLQKSFGVWQINHCDVKRQAFTSKIADKHYKNHLKRKVYLAWHGLLTQRWKQRVEKACKARASEVCETLAARYEQDLAQVRESLQQEQRNVQDLQQERSGFEEAMKRAFMRGVCALNMEAMSMFNKPDGATNTTGDAVEIIPQGPEPPRLHSVPEQMNLVYPHVPTPASEPIPSVAEDMAQPLSAPPVASQPSKSVRSAVKSQMPPTSTRGAQGKKVGTDDRGRKPVSAPVKSSAAHIGTQNSRTRPAVYVERHGDEPSKTNPINSSTKATRTVPVHICGPAPAPH